MKTLFENEYSDEELHDVGRDILEVLGSEFNEQMLELPKDEHGFRKGIFTVTITWVE